MNKQMKILICVVMLVAVLLMAFCMTNWLNLGSELRSGEQQLAESREKWQSVAAEKETLQVDLKAGQKELKENQLYLEEKTARAAELKSEIEKLREEIEALKQQQPSGH